MNKIIIIFVFLFSLSYCQNKPQKIKISQGDVKMGFKLVSNSFNEGELIPSKYTCDAENVSPELHWFNTPENTKSLVLICDDPDAPMGTWVHWVLYNISSNITSIEENISPEKNVLGSAIQGINDFGKYGYGGPCPPSCIHRYFFKLYALDQVLHFDKDVRKKDIINAMDGHLLAETQLMGKYKRQ